MAELNALHHRETQNMLSDFNKAQELLKDKISALQILWVHAPQKSLYVIYSIRILEDEGSVASDLTGCLHAFGDRGYETAWMLTKGHQTMM